MADTFRSVDVTRVRGGSRSADCDRAATEEPLEIRLHGRPFAVIMRTPGADRELAAGFLLAERVITSADDLGTIEHCRPAAFDSAQAREAGRYDRPEGGRDDPNRHAENIVNVTLVGEAADTLERVLAGRRQVTTNSSCGLCGRVTIESLRAEAPPIRGDWTMTRAVISGLPERLRVTQSVFDETGGLHAAGLFTPDGTLEQVAEDVGRHNAVDKVVGRMLMRDALPLEKHALLVSGRTSFEIVQKAFLAGIPLVGSVSAPSSLAIALADEAGLTLVGFVRGDGFNIYAHADRIRD